MGSHATATYGAGKCAHAVFKIRGLNARAAACRLKGPASRPLCGSAKLPLLAIKELARLAIKSQKRDGSCCGNTTPQPKALSHPAGLLSAGCSLRLSILVNRMEKRHCKCSGIEDTHSSIFAHPEFARRRQEAPQCRNALRNCRGDGVFADRL